MVFQFAAPGMLIRTAQKLSGFAPFCVLLLLGLLGPRPSIYWFSSHYFWSYLISLLFIVWTMVAPVTPSHSVLVLSFVPNTGKHGPCAGPCADRLGI